MDPLILYVLVGCVGGVLFALVLARLNRRSSAGIAAGAGEPVSTDIINIARIRVAGVGGLGLVAMAVAVALAVPDIGRPLAAGLALGILLGVAMILFRRAMGPIPSSSAHPGANAALSIDEQQGPRD